VKVSEVVIVSKVKICPRFFAVYPLLVFLGDLNPGLLKNIFQVPEAAGLNLTPCLFERILGVILEKL